MTLDTRDIVKRVGALKQRSTKLLDFAMEKALVEPVFLTEADLVDEDFDLPEAWQLKLTPSSEADLGFTETLVSPEGQELAFEDVFVSPEGLWVTRAQRDAGVPAAAPIAEAVFATPDEELLYKEYVRTGGTFDVETWTLIGGPTRLSDTDIETLLNEIFKVGRTPEMEALLLRIAPGATDLDIEGFFAPTGVVVTDESVRLFAEVFPEGLNVDAFMDLGMEKPDELLMMILRRGDSEASRNLIRSLWPSATEENIEKLFTRELPPAPADEDIRRILDIGGVPDDEIEKIIAQSKLDLDAEGWLEQYKAIDPSLAKDFMNSLPMRSISAGYGDLVAGAAGLAGWAGNEQLKENLMGFAESFQNVAPPAREWDVSLKTLLDPRFWSTVIARALPFSVAMIPISLLTFGTGSAALAAVGMGGWKAHILASIFGGASGAILESSFEAGSVWNEAKAMGWTDEDANKAAQSAFTKNVFALTGTNAIQLFAAFLPDPTRVLNRLVGKGLATVTRVGGKITTISLTEGGEEVIQAVIERQALGLEVKWDDEMKMQFMIGAIMGIGMGGSADVLTTITNRTAERLPVDLKAEFDTTVARLKADGASDMQARVEAFDKIADNKEVQDITDQVIEEVIQEESIESVKKEDKIEELAWENVAKPEAVITPEAPVTPEVSEAIETFLATPDEQILRATNEIRIALEARGFSRDFIDKMSFPEMKQALRQPIPKAVPEVPVTEPGQPEAGLQPEMFGEPPTEVRPPGKGRVTQISMEDQLKLQQAREAAEEASTEDREAFEAHTEAEGLKANLEVDPVARYRVQVGTSKKGKPLYRSLDFFVSIKEQAFPDTFTVKQAKLLRPNDDWSFYAQKGTPQYNKIPRDNVLDTIATELGFDYTGGIDDLVNRVMAIRGERVRIKQLDAAIQTHYTEKPLKTVPEPKEVAVTPTGEKELTPAQRKRTLKLFGLYVGSPNAINAWELTRELQRKTLAGKGQDFKDRTQQLMVEEGLGAEEAMNQALEMLRGELPVVRTEYLSDLTKQMRAVLFNEVVEVLKNEPFEMASTRTALTNALTGRPIPREPGIKGGSAYTRLQRVFGVEVVNALDKVSKGNKSLQDVIEALYEVTGLDPIPVDQAMSDYLRKLSTAPLGQAYLSGDTPSLLKLTEGKSREQITKETTDLKIDLAAEPIPPSPPHEPPIEDALKQMPLFPRPASDMVIKVLKEMGMLPVDIGNFFRANLASFDFSFWRQQAALIASHPVSFVQANIEAWNAIWSKKSSEASQLHITQDPLYQIYEVAEEAGGDFLRPLELQKGTAQWRGVEEFGYLTGDRLLPRLTAKMPWVKLSSRSFVIGTNVHNWLIFKNFHKGMLKLSEQYASGQKTLKVGEVFDIQKELVDFSKSLANFTARGSLGRFSSTAPILSSLFFAPRASIGRLLSVKDLINANPRVRKEAWKNASLFVSVVGGMILLGGAMGWWQVEKDPRRADYMSVKIGNTRVDPWGGYRQFFVFFTRMITGSGVSSISGAEYEADPIRTITSLIKSKSSPLASIITDFWTGKNFIGEEVDIANPKQWAERIAPFAIQDIYEAWLEDPLIALGIAIPAIVGAGVQTYTGDWVENFAKLGLPKYSENLAYGMTQPYYDTQDFYSDHSSEFAGVGPATLTEEKGFPNYIKALVEAKIIKKELSDMPNQKLVNLNADASKGTTFADYYQMWRDREKIVEDEEARIEFDKKFPRAELGNFSQRQFALLNEYWAITDEVEQAEFLEEHESEIGVNLRQDWLKAHPKENAQLAVWGQAKILSFEAGKEVQRLIRELDIPDNAVPETTVPSGDLAEDYFNYSEIVSDFGASSAEAKLFRLEHGDLANWGMANLGWDSNITLRGMEYYELQIKSRDAEAEYDALDDTGDREKYLEDNPEFRDDRRRMDAMEYQIPENQIEDYVEYYNIERAGYEDDWFLMEHPEFYKTMVDFDIWKERDFSKVPTREVFTLFEEWEALRDENGVALRTERREFEAAHPDLDQWLNLTKGTKLESERNGVTTTVKEETEIETKEAPPKEEVDPNLDNRRYWLDQASHYKDVLKNLGIRADITAEELTDAQANEIEKAIVAIRGW